MPKQSLHAVIYKDANSEQWVAVCLEYDVATQGDSEQHAFEMIQEAVELHIEDMTKEELERIYIPVGSEPLVRNFEVRAPAILHE